jgi:hypothetical protein
MALNNSAVAAQLARATSCASESSTDSFRRRSNGDSCGQNKISGRNLLDELGPRHGTGAAVPSPVASEAPNSPLPAGTDALTLPSLPGRHRSTAGPFDLELESHAADTINGI